MNVTARSSARWFVPGLVVFLLVAGSRIAPAQHQHDPPAILAEHNAVMALVPDSAATHRAVQSGRWADPRIWDVKKVPNKKSKVIINAGVEVLLDHINHTSHETIRLDGKLTFSPAVNTGLLVDTMVITPAGHLQIGTAAVPVRADVEAKIIIADSGAIDLQWDPRELSRGLISHGRVTMHGAVRTSHLDLQVSPKRKDKELVFAQVPVGWRVGDLLVLPGTHPTQDYDETLVITAISGNRVTVTGLKNNGSVDTKWNGVSGNHRLDHGLHPFVVNLSRNVVIESENVKQADELGVNRRRGHVMFMHSGVGKTDTRYVGAYGLGRTDKRTPLESPEFDAHGVRVANRGHNAVGRYAWHFHRGGPAEAAAVVQGLAIVDSPGLGLVNHSSNVQVSDSAAFNVVGSAWFTEAGDEVGIFDNVAAVRMPGSGEGVEARRHPPGVIQEVDFGHSGHGFWLQGGGVTVRNARVSGSGDAAIIFFTVPLNEAGLGTARFNSALLANPAVAQGKPTVAVGAVPLNLDGAYVFGCRRGIATKFHQLGTSHGVPSVIQNVTTFAAGTPLDIPYTHNLIVNDCRFLGTEVRPGGSAMSRNSVTRTITFQDMNVRWWGVGLNLPVNGHNKVIRGTYQSVRDIFVSTTADDNRLIELLGDISFPALTAKQLTTGSGAGATVAQRYEVYLQTSFNPSDPDITRIFQRDIIRLGTVKYQNKQLFYYAQAADYVPFKAGVASPLFVPAALMDLSNAQLWQRYGLAVGDAIAPANAFEDPLIHALIADPIQYAPQVRIRSRQYSNNLAGYRIAYDVRGANGVWVRRNSPTVTPIIEGWNLFTVTEEGQLRTLFAFGDITPPGFILSAATPDTINPLDLARGFRVVGTVTDNSFGSRGFSRTFSGAQLAALPVQTRVDGSQFIQLVFSVSDFAGNQTQVTVELTLDPSEPLDHVKKRVVLPKRPVIVALKYLLGFADET